MAEQGDDRISTLPEDVIIHILSFLEIQHVVQTSVLSKRWKHLCYTVPNLIFHLHSDMKGSVEARYRYFRQSISLIDRRLHSFPSHPIHKISLIYKVYLLPGEYRVKLLIDWLIAVTRVRVQQLCLKLPWVVAEEIPELFTCESLVELKLGITQLLPRSIHLPNLKILHLHIFGLSNGVVQRLLSSCPLLECFSLSASFNVAREYSFNISLPKLKRLVLKIFPDVENWKYRFVIDAPVLETLHITGHLGIFQFSNSTSVVEARIGVFGDKQYYNLRESDILRLLAGISSVKSLRLPACMVKVLDYCKGRDLLCFPNLTRLKLRSIQKSPVLELLRLMPNLEYLKLCDRKFNMIDREVATEDSDNVSRESDADDDDDVPSCLLSRMKVIEIEDNYLWRSHMQLMKYFLKNGKVLQKMVFDCKHIKYKDYGDDIEPDLMKVTKTYETEDFIDIITYQTEIPKFPRGSKTCEIEILGPELPNPNPLANPKPDPNPLANPNPNPVARKSWRSYGFLICLWITCFLSVYYLYQEITGISTS